MLALRLIYLAYYADGNHRTAVPPDRALLAKATRRRQPYARSPPTGFRHQTKNNYLWISSIAVLLYTSGSMAYFIYVERNRAPGLSVQDNFIVQGQNRAIESELCSTYSARNGVLVHYVRAGGGSIIILTIAMSMDLWWRRAG